MAGTDIGLGDRLNRYLDAHVRNGNGRANGHAPGLDPDLVQVINRLDARDDAPTADPMFTERLLEELMATTVSPSVLLNDVVAVPAMTEVPAERGFTLLPWMPRRPIGSRWALAHLATAALLTLALVSSFFAFGPGRPGRQPEAPALIPAIVATPATPITVKTPVAEFLWETHGGADVPFEDKPYAVTLDPDGNLWVLDGQRHQFQVFSPEGTYLESWGMPGSGDGEFNFIVEVAGWPSGDVAFDREGNLYVSDPGNLRIQKFGPDRQFIAAWGSRGDGEGQFLWPGQVEVDSQGRVYVPDEFRHDVQVFASDGSYLRTIGGLGADDGEFNLSGGSSIAIDADDNLWVIDSSNYRIQTFSPDGEFLAKWGTSGYEPGTFAGMAGLAVDSDNRAYVSQSVGDKVQIFGADGAYLGAWGGSGSDPGEFFNPQGIVVDGEGNAYVSDFGNERIQKFRLNVPAAAAGPASVVATLIETRVPNMPGGLITIMVDHWFFPTEPSTLRFPEQGGGPTIVVSEAEGFVASVAGDEQRLLPGRALLIPREGSLRKSGSAAESAYSVGFVEAPANGQHDPGIYAENSVEAMTDVIPAGAADVVLERITLAAGTTYPAYLASDLEWIGSGPGNLGVTLTGDGKSEWTSGKERQVSPHFSAPQSTPGWEVLLRNTGDVPVEVHRLRVTPLADTATPEVAAAPEDELVWEAKGDPDNPLGNPYALAVDPAGNIWVEDSDRNQFQIIAPDGAFLESWGGPAATSLDTTRVPETGVGSFKFALGDWLDLAGLAFDGDGNFYVLDAGNHRVQKFGSDRSFLLAWGSEGEGDGQFRTPGGIATDRRGHVYVLDLVRHDVQIFDGEGRFLSKFGSMGGDDGEFYLDNFGFITVDAAGNIWVADPAQYRVQKFSPAGEFLASIGEHGYGEGQFSAPGAVAVDEEGRVYVPDWTNSRIHVFAADGNFLRSWVPPGDGPYGPNTIVLDDQGNAYVADNEGRRIVKYRLA